MGRSTAPARDCDQECEFSYSYSHEPADGSDRPLLVTELALRMDGLTKSGDDSEARARSAEATVFLSYADLSDALGLELTRGYGSDPIPSRTSRSGRVALPEADEKLLGQVFAEPIAPRNIPDGLR